MRTVWMNESNDFLAEISDFSVLQEKVEVDFPAATVSNFLNEAMDLNLCLSFDRTIQDSEVIENFHL